MTRLAMAALLGQSGHLALAAQSQIPMRVGDCVKATTDLEFFFKDDGEYEHTHNIQTGQHGSLLNIDSDWNEPSDVEFIDPQTREPVVSGAVFFHQFARVPWVQGHVTSDAAAYGAALTNQVCMTAKDGKDGYAPVVRMDKCTDSSTTDSKKQWNQQWSYNADGCGARPIRSTDDPSKCLDAVSHEKVLLTPCSGVDTQKFLFRCSNDVAHTPAYSCYILAMGGRKDLCLWWDKTIAVADLQLRRCNFGDATAHTDANRFLQEPFKLIKDETRAV